MLIGPGTVVMPGVSINSNTKIGSQCIINTNSSIDHDNHIKKFSSLGPGVNTGGNVKLESFSHIGIGSSINHNISIKKKCNYWGRDHSLIGIVNRIVFIMEFQLS